MSFKNVLQIFGALAVLFTLLPLIAIDYWWIRIFDYPHTQLTILTFVAIVVYFMRFNVKQYQDYVFVIILLSCFAFQFTKIYPYMPFAPYEVLDSTSIDTAKQFSIYSANVLQKNDKPELLIQEIKDKNADVYLFLETNKKWQKIITENLSSEYKYRVEKPLDNTYGMLLYSKLELISPEIKFMVDDSIPSIHAKMILPSKDTVQIYTIHPTPPMPQHNPSSSDRDAEMMKTANLSRQSKLPVIVFGDFNDVAWSATTSLFHNVAELLDVRKGRGFYNSFSANSPILRWPLDHIFISSEFRLKQVKLGEDINSDHFPTYTILSFEPGKKNEQKPIKPTEKELKRAKQQAEGIRKVDLDM